MPRAFCLSFFTSLLAVSCAGAQTADPLDYVRSEQWPEAARAYAEVITQNPYDGVGYFYYGLALQETDECEQAMPAFSKALELGVNGVESGMRIASERFARCAATTDDLELAYKIVEQAWRNHGLRDFSDIENNDAFSEFRQDPRFQLLTGFTVRSDNPTTAEKWRADIGHFKRLIIQTHPEPFHTADGRKWETDIDALAARVPEMTDIAITKALMGLAARIGDGHTAIYPPIGGPEAWRVIPVWPIWYKDGWYVAAADPAHADLVGARIVSAAGRPFQDMVAQAQGYISADNEATHYWLAGTALQFAELYLEGENERAEEIDFEFELADGSPSKVKLPVGPLDRNSTAWAPPEHWSKPERAMSVSETDIEKPFYHRQMKDTKIVYVRINQVADADDLTFEDYGIKLATYLREVEAEGLVLDLRLNNGGNGNLRWPFLRHLIAYEGLQRDNSIAILTGPRTYSAAMMLAHSFRSVFDVTFVGAPTGGRPVGYATETPFTLPYSQLSGSISNRLHIDGLSTNDVRPWISPDHVVWPTGGDWRKGYDPVLMKALQVLQDPR